MFVSLTGPCRSSAPVLYAVAFGIDLVNNSWPESGQPTGWLPSLLWVWVWVCMSPGSTRRKVGKSNAVLPPTGLRLADITGKVFSADGRQLFWKPSSYPLCDLWVGGASLVLSH